MKGKRFLAAVLTAAMACGSCCISGAAASDTADMPVVHFLFNDYYSCGMADLAEVQAALNEILAERYGIQIDMEFTDSSALEQQMTMKILSGETIDLVVTTGTVALQYQNENMFLDMKPYLEEYGSGITSAFYDNGIGDILDKCETNGSLYYLPNIEPKQIGYYICVNEEMMNEAGASLDGVTCMEDMEEVYAKVLEANPDVYCYGGFVAGSSLLSVASQYTHFASLANIDIMGTSGALGVLMDRDSTTVEDLYESDGYKEACTTLHNWYEAGYIAKDAATSTESGFSLFKEGKQFSLNLITEMDEDQVSDFMTRVSGFSVASALVSTPVVSYTRGAAVIPVTAQEPEAAVTFLNALYTDQELMDIFCYGIQGTHWELDEDGGVVFYDESGTLGDTQSTAYQPPFFMFAGNMAIAHSKASLGGESYREKIYSGIQNATVLSTYGFAFDYSNVDAEYSACQNAIQEYYMGLETGATDPETELPKLIEKLKDSGIDDIIAEKQAQYDAFLAEK